MDQNNNFAKSKLADDIMSGAISCTVTTGEGSLFAVTTGKILRCAIDSEIVYVTARSADTLTITRAQEGTSAAAHTSGTDIANLWTAGGVEQLKQDAHCIPLVNAASHGFTTGQAAYNTGSGWAKAKADNANTLGVGLFVVLDANNFTVQTDGYITGLSGLTAGQYYYVSDATAGALTTEPTAATSYSNPILFALSSTTGIILPYRPVSAAAVSPSNVSRGTYAGRPAAGVAGRLYHSTDAPVADAWDDGTLWHPVLGGVELVEPPLVGALTAHNSGGTLAVSQLNGALLVTSANDGASAVNRGWKWVLSGGGSESIEFTANLLSFYSPFGVAGSTFAQIGIGFLENGTNKAYVAYFVTTQGSGGLTYLRRIGWTSNTAFTPDTSAVLPNCDAGGPWILKVARSGANIILSAGRDRSNLVQIESVAASGYFTTAPDRYFIGALGYNTTAKAIIPHLVPV